ncbi:ferrous iron transporter B, partial [Shewanella sp. 11B5]
QQITPLFSPMGIEQDNWAATVGIITGIFAKEAVVGTLNSLYSTSAGDDEELLSIWDSVKVGLATIPTNLLGIEPGDPLSIAIAGITDLDEAAMELSVDTSTFSALQTGFKSQIAAFSYLLFILLYTPCVAAMGALVHEFGAKWARFAAIWTFSLAYGSATVVYQGATFNQHPVQSASWISFFVMALVVFYFWLNKKGRKAQQIIPGIRIVTE